MVNYYNLLHIAPNADDATIRTSIKKERRVWNQRASHPKQEIRTEAEQKVRDIAEAENVLLNPTSRAQYNQTLTNNPSPVDTGEPITSGEKDWLVIAKQYWTAGNTNSASYAVREAVQQQPDNPDAWYWKAVISSGMKNYSDAQFELNEAIRLNSSEPDYQYELGSLYFDCEQYQAALSQFIKVQEMDKNYYKPDSFLRLRIQCLWGMKNFPIVYPLFTDWYNRCGSDPEIADLYATFIHEMILNAWSTDLDGSKRITNWTQYNFTKQWQQVLNNLSVYDQLTREEIIDTNRAIIESETKASQPGAFQNFMYGNAFSGAAQMMSGKRMTWEWNAAQLPPEVLRTGMQ